MSITININWLSINRTSSTLPLHVSAPTFLLFYVKHFTTCSVVGQAMPKLNNAISETVYIGPYRTLFNSPATITIPIDTSKITVSNRIRAYIFNDLSQSFEPIFLTPGGSSISVDMDEGTASFDTQVLGVFAIGMEDG